MWRRLVGGAVDAVLTELGSGGKNASAKHTDDEEKR
jgi:hypothetical protein